MKKETPDAEFFRTLSREQLFSVFLNQVDLCVFFKDLNGKYVLCSGSFARLMGFSSPSEIVGRELSDLVSAAQADRMREEEQRIIRMRIPVIGLEEHVELLHAKSQVGDVWLSTSVYPLIGSEGEVCGVWGISQDITSAKNTEQKLVQKNKQCDELNSKILQLSTIDETTGLYNRRYFEASIERNRRIFSRVRGRGYSTSFSIILMDIDGFTSFCNEYGPQYRDIALKHVADTLRSCSRSSDDIFRVGNDEFALILSDTTYEGAETLSGRIREAMKKAPLLVDDKTIPLTLSFGYSSFNDQLDTSEMIMQADQSLFDAKKKRKGKSSKKSETEKLS